jgi:hypothetical protein
MQIPASWYGLFADVRARSRSCVAALRQGASWSEAVGAENLLETSDNPGLIVLHGPDSLLSHEPHFHCYLTHGRIIDRYFAHKLDLPAVDRVFTASLATPWGTLGLLSEWSQGYFFPPERHRPFFDAVVRFWPQFLAEGPRFSDGRDWGVALWSVQRTLSYVLVHLGVPQEVVRAHRPDGDLGEFLPYIGK